MTHWLGAGFLVVVWQRPFAFALLLVPVLLLFVIRLPARPRAVATGTARIWRDLAARRSASSGSARRRIPAWVPAASLALVSGVVALAGPRAEVREEPRRWTVVVDRGPGMALPWIDPESGSPAPEGGQRTRGEVALRAARELLTGMCSAKDRVTWRAPGREPMTLSPAEQPPEQWLRPGRTGVVEGPGWEHSTGAGTLWVSDRMPSIERGAASVAVSGGAAVAGPIAAVGEELLVWDPEGAAGTEPRRPGVLVLARAPASVEGLSPGPPFPPLVEALIRAWARSRGIGSVRALEIEEVDGQPRLLTTGGLADVVLVVEGVGDWSAAAPTAHPTAPLRNHTFRLREPGLVAAGSVLLHDTVPRRPGPPAEGPLETRWSAVRGDGPGEVPLLLSAPGWVHLSIADLEPPEGDPAAFAVRFASLLDAALLPPPGVVPRQARAAAGERIVIEGEPAPRIIASGRSRADGLEAWLAGLAALAGFVALLLWRVPRAVA